MHHNPRGHSTRDQYGSSEEHRQDGKHRHMFGATAKPKQPTTVTGAAGGLVDLAARPVKWAFFQAGGLVKWAGGTLQSIGRKL